MTRKINVAIIALGRSGRFIHAELLNRLKDLYTIRVVSDPMEERRKEAEAAFGCESVADYREILSRDDVDVIVNAAPSHLHVSLSEECLGNGFHVLCEKPVARRAEDVDRLIEASRRSGKVMAVFHQSRYAPGFKRLREYIESGRIGRVVSAAVAFNDFKRRWDWQTLKDKNGGNLLNIGSHALDLALQLFGPGDEPEVGCAMDRANSTGDAEDFVKIWLRGSGKPAVDVEISSCDAFPGPLFKVQGTRGGIVGTRTRLDVKYFLEEEAPVRELVTAPMQTTGGGPDYCKETLNWREERWAAPSDDVDDAYTEMGLDYYRMLHRTLASGAPLEVTMQEVRLQTAVIESCFRLNPQFDIDPGRRNAS